MRALQEFAGQELTWVRTKLAKMAFELRAGEEVVAALTWRRGAHAVGETAEGERYFNRTGAWRKQLPIALSEDGPPIATFAPRGTGGSLEFSDGRAFTWRKDGFWGRNYVWLDASGATMLNVHRQLWRSRVSLTLLAEAARLPELPLLALLTQYIVALMAQDEATIAAVTVATTG